MLARVGEEKASFEPVEKADAAALAALTTAFAEVRQAIKARKSTFETTQIPELEKATKEAEALKKKLEKELKEVDELESERPGGPRKAVVEKRLAELYALPDMQSYEAATKQMQNIVMSQYPEALKPGPWKTLLETMPAFTAAKLKIVDDTVVAGGKTIAHLKRGRDVYSATGTAPAGRVTFTRTDSSTRSDGSDKEYVADDFGVPTRRFAYMEKSIYQFMTFASSEQMTGRYQRLLTELGGTPTGDVALSTVAGVNLPQELRATGKATISPIQLAILHQWKGSGVQQRGLSLTSTPRRAVYGNRGESFTSADGVRYTIDLAKVPPTTADKSAKLINHYASGGVKDIAKRTGEDRDVEPGVFYEKAPKVKPTGGAKGKRQKPPKKVYNYPASVIKNRELYLERLDPEWIHGIEVHGRAVTSTTETGAKLVAHVAKEIAQDEYLTAYRAVINASSASTPTAPSTAGPSYTVGLNAGTAYAQGYAAGVKHGAVDQPQRLAALVTAYNSKEFKAKQRYEDFWVGWAHAVAGKTKGAHLPSPSITPPSGPAVSGLPVTGPSVPDPSVSGPPVSGPPVTGPAMMGSELRAADDGSELRAADDGAADDGSAVRNADDGPGAIWVGPRLARSAGDGNAADDGAAFDVGDRAGLGTLVRAAPLGHRRLAPVASQYVVVSERETHVRLPARSSAATPPGMPHQPSRHRP